MGGSKLTMAEVLEADRAQTSHQDDDDWLDWETRKDYIPFWKHVIAGKTTHSPSNKCRLVRRHYGALRDVPNRHDKGKSPPFL